MLTGTAVAPVAGLRRAVGAGAAGPRRRPTPRGIRASPDPGNLPSLIYFALQTRILHQCFSTGTETFTRAEVFLI